MSEITPQMIPQEFPADIWEDLAKRGAISAGPGRAYFPVKPAFLSAQVLDFMFTETTGPLRALWQGAPQTHLDRHIERFKQFGAIQGFFKKTCTKYRNPIIGFDILPLRIVNVHLHLLSGKISGNITNQMGNRSKEGEKGTDTVRRWQSCPTEEGAYSWSRVAGSADLRPNWGHQMIEEETQKPIVNISQRLDAVRKDQRVSTTGNFEQGGIGDVLKALLSILLRGAMTVKNGYSVTVQYAWKNQTQTKSYRISSRVRLPVEGGVNCDWN